MSDGWIALIAAYWVGVVIGMMMSMSFRDELPRWYERPLILIWPVTLLVLGIWHLALFLAGRE